MRKLDFDLPFDNSSIESAPAICAPAIWEGNLGEQANEE